MNGQLAEMNLDLIREGGIGAYAAIAFGGVGRPCAGRREDRETPGARITKLYFPRSSGGAVNVKYPFVFKAH